MANIRPAGLSDEDSDSDDYGFYEKPIKNYYQQPQNPRKKIENDLQDAIINGNLKQVEEAVSSDLNNSVNLKLDGGWTPLMHACFHAQDKIVQFLLDKGADPNYHADSVTPIMAACSNGGASSDAIYNIVTSLIENDCILNIGDKYGQTPLMRAISSGRYSVVEKLLNLNINIEMRDQQGWTAVFWAVHHNQPEILELLISRGARLNEVDKANRKPMDIAQSHDYDHIVEILKKHLNIKDEDEVEKDYVYEQLTTWQDFYPGMKKDVKPTYLSEIPHLLYGMNCESLSPVIQQSGMDLRTFLLLEEQDMVKLGIGMPYERNRLKLGLYNFHKRGWKLNAVAGLFAKQADNFSVLDCLTALGSHLQQLYILEATLQYALRQYKRLQDQVKFEPPDSPIIANMQEAAKKLVVNINSIRREMKVMKARLTKISSNNPQPADLIKEPSTHEVALGYITEGIIVCSLGFLVYHAKTFLKNLFHK